LSRPDTPVGPGTPTLLSGQEPGGAEVPRLLEARAGVQDWLLSALQAEPRTVVLVTHDVPEALRLGDRVAVMDAGRVVQEGTPAEVHERPQPGFVPSLEPARDLFGHPSLGKPIADKPTKI